MVSNWGLYEWLLVWGVLSIVPTVFVWGALAMAGREE